jgi:DNA-directed RNA polymerase specialized sigma24 family protein
MRNTSIPPVKTPVLDVASETALALDPPDSGLNPEETCLQLERKRIVVAAINKLTPTLRAAMKLRALRDLSTQGTAGILGCRSGRLKPGYFTGVGNCARC